MRKSLTFHQDVALFYEPMSAGHFFMSRRIVRTSCFVAVAFAVWSLLAWGAAKLLVTHSDIANADVILVLSNASTYLERTHRAAELWRDRRAPRVLLTNDNTLSGWSETEKRNPFFFERATQELQRSGVRREEIEVLPEAVRSTYDEAVVMRSYAIQHGLRSVLIVTSAYHSRRALWIFNTVFRGTGIQIGLDGVPPGQQTPGPATWWFDSMGWKTVAAEYPKFAYFWIRQIVGAYRQDESLTPTGWNSGASDAASGALLAPSTANVDEVVLIDARGAAGISPAPQSDGSPSLVLDFGDGYTANLPASGHTYRTPGTYTIKIEGKDRAGQTVVSEVRKITISDLPAATGANLRLLKDTGNAKTNAVNLQRAIDQAARSNREEQEIVLPVSAVFAGPIVLTTPSGSAGGNKYITIKSAGLSSLPRGNRVGPADARLMPTITAPSSTNETQSALWTPNPAPAVPSHHYRLQGLHFRKDVDNRYAQALVSLGDINAIQDKVSKLPGYFIVDRCYFNGGSPKSRTKDGLRINADYTSVLDSYLAPFQIAVGPDAVALSIGKGRGPWAIWNSYLEATSENFFIGGGGTAESWSATISNATTTACTLSSTKGLEADMNIALPVDGKFGPDQSTVIRSISGSQVTFDPVPRAPDNGGVARWSVTPSFLEFRRNYLFKPTRWRQGASDYDGSNWQVKNLWETKFLRYAVIDGNVMQNCWVKDQPFAIVLTPRNATGGEHPAVVVRDIQFSNNIFRNLGNGVAIMPSDTQGGYNPTQRTSGITFRNNLFWNVGENWDPGYRQFFSYLEGVSSTDKSLRIHFVHNTFDNGTPKSSQGMITDFGTIGGATQSTWKNNVASHAGYGFRSAVSNEPLENIVKFLPPGLTGWDRNLIANIGTANYPQRPRGVYPSGPWPSMFVDYANGNFALSANSPGKGRALDGSDIGVNMTTLGAATVGAKTGKWNF